MQGPDDPDTVLKNVGSHFVEGTPLLVLEVNKIMHFGEEFSLRHLCGGAPAVARRHHRDELSCILSKVHLHAAQHQPLACNAA
jgi:hypothetical protein